MKKVAVFLRGHLRTWEFNKHNIFNFCDNLAEHVDYYVAVWRTGKDYTKFRTLREDFNYKKLQTFQIVEGHWGYDAWTGPAYLSNLLSRSRLAEEIISGQKYDAILDTRFDVVFNLDSAPVAPQPWHVGSTRVESEMVLGWQGLEDHCFFMNSASHALWNQRIHYDNDRGHGPYINEPNSHVKLFQYANHYGLTAYQPDWFRARIVRPSIINVDKSLTSIFWEIPNLEVADEIWNNFNLSEKLNHLEKVNISPEEYVAALDFSY